MEAQGQYSEVLRRALALPDGEPLSAADADALKAMLARAPYFTVAMVLLLRHGGDMLTEQERLDMSQALALCSSDRRTVLFAKHGDDWAKFYPEEENDTLPATEEVIDTFLRTYGSCTPEEERQLERMIFNPTPDYAELLARQEQNELPEPDEAPEGTQDALINAFIRECHPSAKHPEDEPEAEPETTEPVSRPETRDDGLLSESLAAVFVRKGRYEKAYEIISGLSLKFPKKSAYFADQLRFLQKLIINQRRKEELSEGAPSEK